MACGGMNNMILDTDTKVYSIQCATTPVEELHITSNWRDWYRGGKTIGNSYVLSDGTNLTEVVTSPECGYKREVTSLSVYNPNSNSVTFYITEDNLVTGDHTIIAQKTLDSLESWTLECMCHCCDSGGGGSKDPTGLSMYNCGNLLEDDVVELRLCGCGVTGSVTDDLVMYEFNPTITFSNNVLTFCSQNVDLSSLSDPLHVKGCYNHGQNNTNVFTHRLDFDCCAFNVDGSSISFDYTGLTFDCQEKKFYWCDEELFWSFPYTDLDEIHVANTYFVNANFPGQGAYERFDHMYNSINAAITIGYTSGASEINIIVYPGVYESLVISLGNPDRDVTFNIYLYEGVILKSCPLCQRSSDFDTYPAHLIMNIYGNGKVVVDNDTTNPSDASATIWLENCDGYVHFDEVYVGYRDDYVIQFPIGWMYEFLMCRSANYTVDIDKTTIEYIGTGDVGQHDFQLISNETSTRNGPFNVDIRLGDCKIGNATYGANAGYHFGSGFLFGTNTFKHNCIYIHDTQFSQIDNNYTVPMAYAETYPLFFQHVDDELYLSNIKVHLNFGGIVLYSIGAMTYIKDFDFTDECLTYNNNFKLFVPLYGENPMLILYGENNILLKNPNYCSCVTDISNSKLFGFINSNVQYFEDGSVTTTDYYTHNGINHFANISNITSFNPLTK